MSLTYRRLDYRRIPEVARERQELADTYRQIRSANPAMARLLRRRLRDAQYALVNAWMERAMDNSSSFIGKNDLPNVRLFQ